MDQGHAGAERQRPNLIANPVLSAGDQNLLRYFNTAAFARPAKGTPGNEANYAFTEPGTNNWDAAQFKNVVVKERLRVQFRLETYNTFHHTQFSGLDTTARFDAQGNQESARFGQAISTRNPRRLQLGLELSF